jgi:hypothetical protein
MITKKLRKKSIFKAAIEDYDGYITKGVEKTVKIFKLIEDIDTDESEIINYLNESLSKIYDQTTETFNKLELPPGVTVKSNIVHNKNERFGRISKFFRFVVVTEGYYGVIRMGILLVLNEGDSFSTYDMSYLAKGFTNTIGGKIEGLFEESVSFDGDYVVRSNKMNKEQLKSSKNYDMKQLYKMMTEDMECLDEGDLVYLTEGMGINSDGEIKKM